MSILNRALKNSFITGFGYIFNSLIGLVTLSILARFLLPEKLATYAFVLVLVTISFLVMNSGVNNLMIREISADRSKARRLFGTVLVIKVFLSIITPLLLFALLFTVHLTPAERSGIMIASIWLVLRFFTSTYGALYQAFERMDIDFLIISVSAVVYLGLLVFLEEIRGGVQLWEVFTAMTVSEAVVLFLVVPLTRLRLIRPVFGADLKVLWRFFKDAVPINAIAILFALYYRIDILIFRSIGDKEQIAYYFSVYQLVQQLFFLAASTLKAMFPVFSRLYAETRETVSVAYQQSLKASFVLGAPIAVAIFVLSRQIVSLLFGAEYLSSVPPLRVLAFVVMLTFPNAVFVILLVATKLEGSLIKAIGLCLATNVVCDFLLIPRFSAVGAAMGTLCAEIVLFGFQFYLVTTTLVRVEIWSVVLKPIVCALIMGALVFSLRFLPLMYLAPIGAVAYLLLLMLFKIISDEEMAFIKENISLRQIVGLNR